MRAEGFTAFSSSRMSYVNRTGGNYSMKIIGIIPSRYNSTRFPGKALAPLNGKPMVCRICDIASACPALDEVYVATDSPLIKEACEAAGHSVIMTKSSHKTPTSRTKEAADKTSGDLFAMIGGDEPLIQAEDIMLVLSKALQHLGKGMAADVSVVNAMATMTEPSEISDRSNIKVVCSKEMEGLYTSRLPIPFQKKAGSISIPYRKFVSIGVYTKEALDFFVSTPPSLLERAEECDLLRFIEHRRTVLFVQLNNHPHSVDTPEDFFKVQRLLLNEKGRAKEKK